MKIDAKSFAEIVANEAASSYHRGVAEERARVRREFLAVIESRLEESYMRQLLDRICPEVGGV